MLSILKSVQIKTQKSITDFNSLRQIPIYFALCFTIFITGCVTPEKQVGIVELSSRPGEKALLAGIRSYDDGQYLQAENLINDALKSGFTVPKDAALGYKFLAFIYCTSNRIEECKKAFNSARAADPQFSLNKNEVGHPQWGPVYKQIFKD